MVVVATLIGSVGAFLLKKGAAKIKSFKIKSIIRNLQLISGLGLYAFSTVFYVISLKMGDLSVLYPLTSLSYIWTTFFSAKFLREKMNIFKYSAMAMIVIGIYFIVT